MDGNYYTTYRNQVDDFRLQTVYSSSGSTTVAQCANLPFGDARTCQAGGNPDDAFWFAAMYLDPNGEYHTFARQYFPNQGRWTTPDPAGAAVADPANPQSWNSYTYVLNSPLTYNDPLGLYCPVGENGAPLNGCVQGWDTAVPIGNGGGAGGGFGFSVSLSGVGCDSDFLPCGAPPTSGLTLPCDFGYCGPQFGNEFVSDVFGNGNPDSPFSIYVMVWAPYLIAANNGSWAWNFTKSFFTFAGGPGNVPTCAGQALRHMGETLNPFTPSPSTAAEVAAPVAQAVAINQGVAQTQAGIDAYVAARGLTVPLRSSVVRGMAAEGAEGAVAAGARANLAVQTLAVDYAAINSTITTSGEALSGQCASVLDLLTR